MALRFLHTADLQLGKAFRNIPGDRGAKLRDLRLDAIGRLGDLVQAQRCAFVVIAGDLFDANTVSDYVAIQAAERFRRIDRPIYVIPGNHDFAGAPGAIFSRETFLAAKPDNVHLLTTTDPVVTPAGAVIFPAPLMHRHHADDPTAHVTSELTSAYANVVRIGLAHGSVIDFAGASGANNLIAADRARRANLDYLALGDWHGTYQVDDRTWYAGTPETDRHRDNDSGNALVVEIDGPGAPPRVTRFPVGSTRWIERAWTLHADDDVAALESWVGQIEDPLVTVAAVRVEGALSLESSERVERALATLDGRLLYCHADVAISARPSEDEIRDLAPTGYLKDVVAELLTLVDSDDHAGLALQIMYKILLNQEPA